MRQSLKVVYTYLAFLVLGMSRCKNEAALCVVHFDLDEVVEAEGAALDVDDPLKTSGVFTNRLDVCVILRSTQQQNVVVLQRAVKTYISFPLSVSLKNGSIFKL